MHVCSGVCSVYVHGACIWHRHVVCECVCSVWCACVCGGMNVTVFPICSPRPPAWHKVPRGAGLRGPLAAKPEVCAGGLCG